MSESPSRAGSDEFNALPFDQRVLINRLTMANELRLIDHEKRRIAADYHRAIKEHDERADRIRKELNRQEPSHDNQ